MCTINFLHNASVATAHKQELDTQEKPVASSEQKQSFSFVVDTESKKPPTDMNTFSFVAD